MIGTLPLVAAVMLAQYIDPQTGRHVSPLKDLVTLNLSADRQTYYRGERMRLSLTARNVSASAVSGHFALNPRLGAVRVLYRMKGGEFVQLRCFLEPPGSFALGHRTLAVDDEYTERFDVAVATLVPFTFLLERTGTYELQALHDDAPKGPNGEIASNVLYVDVVGAPPEEREAQAAYTPVLAYLAQVPTGSSAFVTPETMAEAAVFIDRYRQSRYAGPVKEGLFKWLQVQVRTQRASADAVALYEKFMRATDTTAPELHVEASPRTLWPPNPKLVQVLTTGSVSDNEDPSPVVKLVSITCDDGCDVAQDVSGAELGTDDREFELRAERKGSGAGRTYTIVYSATDASGNEARAVTTVVVPHDQGKK